MLPARFFRAEGGSHGAVGVACLCQMRSPRGACLCHAKIVRAKRALIDGQSALDQRASPRVESRAVRHLRNRKQYLGDIGVLWPDGLLYNRQGTPIQPRSLLRLCLAESAG